MIYQQPMATYDLVAGAVPCQDTSGLLWHTILRVLVKDSVKFGIIFLLSLMTNAKVLMDPKATL